MFRSKGLSSIVINSIRGVFENNGNYDELKLIKYFVLTFKFCKICFLGITKRQLYAPAALGIEGFLHSRERIKMQITNVDSFKAKMQEFVNEENSKNLVFTEDLRNSKLKMIVLMTPMLLMMTFCSAAYFRKARY